MWNTPRSLELCIKCGKNLAGHTRDIQAGRTNAHPFITESDKKGKK